VAYDIDNNAAGFLRVIALKDYRNNAPFMVIMLLLFLRGASHCQPKAALSPFMTTRYHLK
jgi:hypothetical protein